jgi:hypothetical protein
MRPATGRRLSPVQVAGEMGSVYRRHWRFLVPAAIVVLIPQSVTDAVLERFHVEHIRDLVDVTTMGVVLLTAAVNLMGQAVYAGLTAAAVVDWRAGQALPPLRTLLRSMPLGRLVVLDVVVTIGAAIGFMLLLVPGLIFLTYVAASAPLMKLEHLGVGKSIRRSIALVRGRAARVFVIVAGAVVVTELGVQAVALPFDGVVALAAANLLGEAIFQPFEGLAVALVAVHLLDLHGQAPTPDVMARSLTGGAQPAD